MLYCLACPHPYSRTGIMAEKVPVAVFPFMERLVTFASTGSPYSFLGTQTPSGWEAEPPPGPS